MIQGYIYTALGTTVIAFSLGYKVHSTITKAKTAEALEAQREAHTEALEALQLDLDSEARERLRLSAELDNALSNVRTVTREIIKEVPSYVKPSTPNCDRTLDPRLIGLLNGAALGTYRSPEPSETTARDISNTLPALTGYPRNE